MATYYVDQKAIGASDANAGSAQLPFLTINKANNVAVSGDTVIVRPGLYREQIACKASNVTWRTSEPGVYIYGTIVMSGSWTPISGSIYRTTYVNTTKPLVVLLDGIPYAATLTAPNPLQGEFYYDSATGNLDINTGGLDPTGHALEAGNLSTGFTLQGITGCTIQGFSVYASNGYGILVQGGGGHTIRDNELFGHPSGGVRLQPTSPQLFQPTDNGAGGTLAAGTYAYMVTAIVGGQETLPSFELTLTIAANHSVFVQCSRIPTATSYNVYARTVGGETLVTSISQPGSGFPTWIDDGSLTPDGVTSPPLSSPITLQSCTVEGNNIWRNLSHGVYLYAATDCLIRGNHCHHNVFHGIALLNGSNNNTVELNDCHSNWKGNRTANGIQADYFGAGTLGSSGNIIRRNRCYRNEDSGISIYNGSNNCIVDRNLCYDNGDHGIDCSSSTNCHMVNNTAYGNVTAGLNAEGTSQGIRMYNNISMDNGVQSPRTSGNYRFDATANQDAQFDNCLTFLTVPATSQTVGSNAEIIWGTTTYKTLSAFTAAVPGYQTNGIAANPRFTVLADRDFTLEWNSPAKGLGSASAPDYSATNFVGQVAAGPPDAGIY
jgi:parallel beta-helix repeat protein